MLSWLVCSVLVGTGALPVGPGQMQVDLDGTRLELFTYKPAGYRDGPLILVFHGVLRNAAEYRDHAQAMADRFGALIVSPRFPEPEFPFEKYQLGGLVVNGQVQPPEQWTWRLVPQIATAIRQREARPEMPYYLIGHSGGGQFLIRLAAFTQPPAQRIVVANPGTYLFPSQAQEFPYGFAGLPESIRTEESLKRYLALPLTIYLGSEDRQRDEYFDQTERAESQGASRWQRGQNAFQAAQNLARQMGWPLGWRLVVAEGVGHDHQKMFDHPRCKLALFGAEEAADSR